MATTVNDTKPDETTKEKSFPGAIPFTIEFLFVCLLSIVVSALHLYLFKGPNLTLLFDGFGFLTTTAGCMSVFNFDALGQVVAYCASGFDESLRVQLAERFAPAQGIVRSGPLLPMLLSVAYVIGGKVPTAQFWSVGTWAMWITQALTIGLTWLSCRITFDARVARIAALLAISYPAFIINGNRLSTETQACLGVMLAVSLFLFYSSKQFDNTRTAVGGLLCGLILGFLALARPPFLLLPILLVVAISFASHRLNSTVPFKKKWFLGVTCGAALFLAPWALCNKIMTGTASITIDRFGAYNLYTGLNAKTFGFDVLPGELVAHPERFKRQLSEVFEEVCEFGLEDPNRFITMAMLKPARLLDTLWNDFQNSCLSVPWLIQRYFHQVILLFGLVGLFGLWKKAFTELTIKAMAPAIVLTLVVAYNFIHLLFISMARYTYPIVPCIIVSAAYGVSVVTSSPIRLKALLVVLLAPVPSLLIESLHLPPYAVLPEFALNCGIAAANVFCVVLVAVAFLVFTSVTKGLFDSNRVLRRVYIMLSLVICVFVTFACDYGLRQLAYPMELGTSPASKKVNVIVQSGNPEQQDWFIVFDPVFTGFSLDALKDCRFTVNGKEIMGDVIPLVGVDSSQRESFVYEKAFAHSAQKDITNIRQWFCVAVPDGCVKRNENEIVMQNESSDRNTYLNCDYIDSGKVVSTVSLRQFSWTKGFTINPPLDMRMFEDGQKLSSFENAVLHPRVYLLSVEKLSEPTVSNNDSVTINLGEAKLDRAGNRMVSLAVAPSQLETVMNGIKSGIGNAIDMKLSGVCYADSGDKGNVSVALISTVGNEETMAPLAPELIPCTTAGTSFSFSELIPVPKDKSACSARILIAGKPWWDVLQYSSYKVDNPVTVKNLTLTASPVSLPNLDKQSWQLYRCNPLVPSETTN